MVFPATILDLKAELLLGSLGWTDISNKVKQNPGPGAVITRGHADESTVTNPSSLALALKNPDGRFSSRNPAGPYYGNLVKNTQVRVSVPEGASYLRSETDQVSYASTPDSAGLSITGDMEIQVDVTLDNWNANQILAAKWLAAGNQRTWILLLNEDGTLTFAVSAFGSDILQVTSTAPVPVPPLGRQAVKVTLTAGTARFYTAPAAISQAPLGPITTGFVQVGGAVAGAGGGVEFDSTAAVSAGAALPATSDYPGYTGIYGKLHSLKLLSGVGGTVKASPDFTVQTPGATSFADGQGNTWTLQGTAEISNRKYRCHMEVASWPQSWDPAGVDVEVSVAGGGLLRRLNQGQRPLQSAIRRYWLLLTSNAPAAYWPCEDTSHSTWFASGLDYDSSQMAVTSGRPQVASNTSFVCSAALPVLNNSAWQGRVPAYSGTDAVLTCLVSIPAAGDTNIAVVAGMNIAGGTCGRIYVLYSTASSGTIQMIAEDRDGTTIGTTGNITGVNGVPLLLRMAVRNSGADIIITQTILPPGGTVTTQSATITTASVGRASVVFSGLPDAVNLAGTAIGHLAVQGTWSDLSGFAVTPSVITGWDGEPAGNRFARLCSEEGLAFRGQGQLSQSVLMGPQLPLTLAALLQECADADRGVIFEPRQQLALGYRTRSSLQNQAPAVALTYARSGGAHLSGSLTPADDDQQTANDVTVSRTGGSSARRVLTSGPLSVQAPPNGVGTYTAAATLNFQSDSFARQEAGWLLHMGTVDENRYPLIQLNLARTAVAGLYYDLQDTDIAGLITISGTPVWVPPDGISQLVQQATERLGGYVFEIDWTGVPASPYLTAVAGVARAATDGSSLVAGISSGATALSADSTGMPWTNAGADLPFDISVRPANVSAGERMTVTAAAGASLTGAYLDQAGMGAADFNAANTIWTGWTGLGMKVSKVFLAAPAAIPQRMTQMNAAGIKICVCLAPAFNPVSATDLANITTLMQAMQAAGMTADVALWQEPYYRGLTAAQYIAGVNYYGPTIRTYYPLVFSTALSSVQNNNENSFYPGDAAVDKIATDYYSINYVNGASLDLAASVADSAVPPKPFGLWEFNALVNGGNFLVQPDAGFEPNSAGDWTNAGNCSIAPGNAQAHSGSWSLALTSAAAGNMAAAHCTAGNITTLGLPCAAGDSIQTTTWFRAQASARSCQAAAAFYTSAGVFVSTLTGGSVTNSTTAWTQGTGTVTAPATAAFCRANPGVLATGAASEVHYIDDVTLTNLNSGYTQAQITAMFNDLRSYFAGRLSGGRKNADLLLYNGAGPNSTEIAAGSDFRIALFQSIAAALNSTSAPQAFTVTRSVNGVVRAHTAGEAITLFTPAVAPLT